jgi:hypothetical protein
MLRLALFSVPVAILPMLVVQAVETVMTRSLLPDVATEMQRATELPAEMRPSRSLKVERLPDEDRLPVPLSLTLRF